MEDHEIGNEKQDESCSFLRRCYNGLGQPSRCNLCFRAVQRPTASLDTIYSDDLLV